MHISTRYIKHLADSANIKGVTFNKLCSSLIENSFEMPNVSYTHTLALIVKIAKNENLTYNIIFHKFLIHKLLTE